MYKELPDRDLLTITVNESVADELLMKFPNLRELAEVAPEELAQVNGLSKAKAKKLLSSIELGKGVYSTPVLDKTNINSPQLELSNTSASRSEE